MYKTIVVHVDGSRQQESWLLAAAMLARDHSAHLVGSAFTGISFFDLALLTGSMAAPVVPVDFESLSTAASLRLSAFTGQVARFGVESVETRLMQDVADYGLVLQSRYADLIVLGQDFDAEPGLPTRVRGLPEQVALRGVRPVLVVPASYHGQPIPGTAVAGWDGSQQALRAITAALPLLERAGSVKLGLINPDMLYELHGEQPGADMALYLARHGIKVDIVLERTKSTVGNALITLARDTDANLMVSGAYGHSRYREWALGGVTRELLAHAPVPLLIAH